MSICEALVTLFLPHIAHLLVFKYVQISARDNSAISRMWVEPGGRGVIPHCTEHYRTIPTNGLPMVQSQSQPLVFQCPKICMWNISNLLWDGRDLADRYLDVYVEEDLAKVLARDHREHHREYHLHSDTGNHNLCFCMDIWWNLAQQLPGRYVHPGRKVYILYPVLFISWRYH